MSAHLILSFVKVAPHLAGPITAILDECEIGTVIGHRVHFKNAAGEKFSVAQKDYVDPEKAAVNLTDANGIAVYTSASERYVIPQNEFDFGAEALALIQ